MAQNLQVDYELAAVVAALANRLQDENDHTGAQYVISRAFAHDFLTERFRLIAQAQQAKGYLETTHETMRARYGRQLTEWLRLKYPTELVAMFDGLLYRVPS